jgi:E3 ubiquitin-protein ligase HERC3
LATADLGTGRTATAITSGSGYTCALLDNATVKCWGGNSFGGLGQGDTNNRGDSENEVGDNLAAIDLGSERTATAIAAGNEHTCAILDTGAVKCWGRNYFGQLGQGDTNDRGDGADEMGDNLPAIDLGTGLTATALALGDEHTCALLNTAAVKCWGWNVNGQLGLGDANNRGDAGSEMGDNLPTVNLGTGRTATAIAAGSDDGQTCALLDNATVKCWGIENAGQLGPGALGIVGDQANEMGNNLSTLSLGTGRTATAITLGKGHGCALLDNGTVKCWGGNAKGQLGQGDNALRGDEANEMGDHLAPISL